MRLKEILRLTSVDLRRRAFLRSRFTSPNCIPLTLALAQGERGYMGEFARLPEKLGDEYLRDKNSPRGSNRRIPKSPQHGVNPRLVTLALRLEPLQYILIDTQRNGCFRRRWLQATAHDAANDAAHCDLWVIFRWRSFRRLIAQACPIGFRLRFRGRRCPLRDAWLCGRR
jgi:hypothetical protein